jgi:hypothetical protein
MHNKRWWHHWHGDNKNWNDVVLYVIAFCKNCVLSSHFFIFFQYGYCRNSQSIWWREFWHVITNMTKEKTFSLLQWVQLVVSYGEMNDNVLINTPNQRTRLSWTFLSIWGCMHVKVVRVKKIFIYEMQMETRQQSAQHEDDHGFPRMMKIMHEGL